MDGRFGFVHGELDTKILILFVLQRLSAPVDQETLAELCLFDEGVSYFDFSDFLSELVANGNVSETEDGYVITEKGIKNAVNSENNLPYSVRAKALKLIAPVDERMRRAAMITAKHSLGDMGCTVSLSMSDGIGKLIDLSFVCADEEQAKRIEKNFRRDAEGYYQKIAAMLSEEKKRKQ